MAWGCENTCKRYYDGVVSLGINCASAMQMEVRELRTFSGPFDWITIDATQVDVGWKTWLRMITTRFQVTVNPSNLTSRNLTTTSSVDYLGDILLQDGNQGLLFPHDFSIWPASFEFIQRVQNQYQRRAARLVERLTKGGHYLFVFNSGNYPCTTSELLQLTAELRQFFPSSQIDLFAVLFGQTEEVDGQEVAPGVFITKTCRSFRDSYDFGGRCATWRWLDSVALREPINLDVDLARRDSFDARILSQVSRWLDMDKKTLKLYHKTYVQAYARGYCRFRNHPFLTCKLPMLLWRKTRLRYFLRLVKQ